VEGEGEGDGEGEGGFKDQTERRRPAPQYWELFPGQGVEQDAVGEM
jgi:hypothetical protein